MELLARVPEVVVERRRPTGSSAEIRTLLSDLIHVASSEATVLLRGESGAGKGMWASILHENSPRAKGPLVEVVCGGLPETLIDSELFGHERGAFSGADSLRRGRFELAAGGTIFLDEIGDLPERVQVKLLRVLDNRRFERVGGTETLTADVRVVAATHRDLAALVRAGRFRLDLYHRLNVVSFHVPPLRRRREDVPVLVTWFLEELAHRNHRPVPRITAGALRILSAHDWPGNVRELMNCLESLIVLDRRGEIREEDVLERVRVASPSSPIREALLAAIRDANGNKSEAARRYGKSRCHFYRLLKQHGIA